eukprot:3694166-Pleurochrysis_carterae.AAC.1
MALKVNYKVPIRAPPGKYAVLFTAKIIPNAVKCATMPVRLHAGTRATTFRPARDNAQTEQG